MKILVDADACPVKEIIVRAAKKYEKEVLMVCDVTHQLFYEEPFVTAKTVDKGADSADLVLANLAQKQDLCVTSDYGLATLFLTKGATVLHPNGFSTATTPLTVCSLNVIFPGKCAARKKPRRSHQKTHTEAGRSISKVFGKLSFPAPRMSHKQPQKIQSH